jgi:hypothetical protein
VAVKSCVPVVPSFDLESSLRFWVEGLGFVASSEMWAEGRLVFCFLNRGDMWFMLNRRVGDPVPEGVEGIRLYWTPEDLEETRKRLMGLGFAASNVVEREYGQREFFVTDGDGYPHCFGVGK